MLSNYEQLKLAYEETRAAARLAEQRRLMAAQNDYSVLGSVSEQQEGPRGSRNRR